MTKGVSIKLASYQETIPKLLKLIKFEQELQKHDHIIIKPTLNENPALSTPRELVELIVAYTAKYKRDDATLALAEGADGLDTSELFESQGYRGLAEHYNVSLIDLNNVECEAIGKNEFVGFEEIMYPRVLKNAFVISLPAVRQDETMQLEASLSNMQGAFPARYYKGIFSRRKNKLDAYPLKYQVHDINLCKMPNFALFALTDKGVLLAGNPLDMDKQAATLLGMDWRSVGYLRMLDETTTSMAIKQAALIETESKQR